MTESPPPLRVAPLPMADLPELASVDAQSSPPTSEAASIARGVSSLPLRSHSGLCSPG